MLHTKRFLIIAWTVLALLFSLFACWAFYVQTVNDNPLLPAFISLAAALGAAFVAVQLHRTVYGSKNFKTVVLVSSLLLIPLGLAFLGLGQADDSPGAGAVGLLFLAFSGLGLWTAARARGTSSAS